MYGTRWYTYGGLKETACCTHIWLPYIHNNASSTASADHRSVTDRPRLGQRQMSTQDVGTNRLW